MDGGTVSSCHVAGSRNKGRARRAAGAAGAAAAAARCLASLSAADAVIHLLPGYFIWRARHRHPPPGPAPARCQKRSIPSQWYRKHEDTRSNVQ